MATATEHQAQIDRINGEVATQTAKIAQLSTILDGKAAGGGAVEMISFIITNNSAGATNAKVEEINSFVAEKDMTWQEWIVSDYNTFGVFDSNGYPAIEGTMMGVTVTQFILEDDSVSDAVHLSDLLVNNGKYKAS